MAVKTRRYWRTDGGKSICGRWVSDFGNQLSMPLREIDIIAEKDFCFHFVEVKTRRGDDFGYPAEAVNETKQRRMQAAARYYMHMNRLENVRVQFDVVEIEVNQISNCI